MTDELVERIMSAVRGLRNDPLNPDGTLEATARAALAAIEAAGMVVVPKPNDLFKLVYKHQLLELAGPVKGRIPEERRAAQLIREAWNKLPDNAAAPKQG